MLETFRVRGQDEIELDFSSLAPANRRYLQWLRSLFFKRKIRLELSITVLEKKMKSYSRLKKSDLRQWLLLVVASRKFGKVRLVFVSSTGLTRQLAAKLAPENVVESILPVARKRDLQSVCHHSADSKLRHRPVLVESFACRLAQHTWNWANCLAPPPDARPDTLQQLLQFFQYLQHIVNLPIT